MEAHRIFMRHCPASHGADCFEKGTRPDKRANITMKNHHVQWENPLKMWSFSIAMLKYQRVINQYGFFEIATAHIDRWSLINLPKKRPWAMWAIVGTVGTAGQSPRNDFHGDMFRKSTK